MQSFNAFVVAVEFSTWNKALGLFLKCDLILFKLKIWSGDLCFFCAYCQISNYFDVDEDYND